MSNLRRIGSIGLLLSLGMHFEWATISVANPAPRIQVAQNADLEEADKLEQQVQELYKQGKFKEAIPLAERVAEARKRLLGQGSPKYANALINLASLYQAQGSYGRAEPLYQKSLTINKQVLGDKHPGIAKVLNILATLYQTQGRYGDAEHLYQESLTIIKQALDTNHPDIAYISKSDIAKIFSNFALLYQNQGRYGEAESLYQKSLTIFHHALGANHPDVAISLGRLAWLHYKQGRYKEAESLYQESLTIRRQALGANHPLIADSLNDLAVLYRAQGRYGEAEPLFKESLTISRQALGTNHPSTATSLNNLAGLYQTQGRYGDAEHLYQESLTIRRQALGANHPLIADSLNDLAVLYQAQGRYGEAEPLFKESLTISRQALGTNHPSTATSLINLAGLYQTQGRYGDAEHLYQESLTIIKQALGTNHPSTATSLNNLAMLYQNQGRYGEAEPLFKESLTISRQALGTNHPSTATSLNNLAMLYHKQGRYREAEPLFRESLTIRRQALGANHPLIADSLNDLAVLYANQGYYREAEPLLKESLTILRQTLGANHPDIAISLKSLAVLYSAQNNLPLTLQYLTQGLDIEEKNLTLNLATGSEQQKREFLSLFQWSTDTAIALHQQLATNNPQAAKLALTTILRRKGRLLDVLGQSFQRLRNSSDPKVNAQLNRLVDLQSQISGLTSRGPSKDKSQYQINLDQLIREQQQLTSSLSNSSSEVAREFQPIEIEQVQKAIPKDAALIEFIEYQPYVLKAKPQEQWGPPHFAVYVLTPQGDIRWADLGLVSEIKPLIAQFIDRIQDPSLSEQEIKSSAQELESKIMLPMRQLVGDAQHLLIAPDGDLNLIPFEALVNEDGQYLLQQYQITYLTSGRDLLRLQDPLPGSQAPILLAYPTYDQRGASSPTEKVSKSSSNQRSSDLISSFTVDPLPNTLVEGEAISKLLPNSQLYIEDQATETILKQTANPSVLHVATHGFFLKDLPLPSSKDPSSQLQSNQSPPFLPENPLLRSGLALAGFNLRNQQKEGDDGVLTALEVSGLDLRGTQLVVMSACKTGVGKIENGEGVYGLRRAFTLAGARSQLMSLWKVDDAGTKELMVAYYDRLKQGKGRAEALREVQLAMLEGELRSESGQSYREPYYWAAFVRVGDWRSIKGL